MATDLRPQKNDVLRVKHRRTLERRLEHVERRMATTQLDGAQVTIWQMQEVAAIRNALLVADRCAQLRDERNQLARQLPATFWRGWIAASLTYLAVIAAAWAAVR